MIDRQGRLWTTARIALPVLDMGTAVRWSPGDVATMNHDGLVVSAYSERPGPGRFLGVFWNTWDTDRHLWLADGDEPKAVILLGHTIVPTDCFEVAYAYGSLDPLYLSDYGRFTSHKPRPEAPVIGRTLYAPTPDYPYLTVEYQTATPYEPSRG